MKKLCAVSLVFYFAAVAPAFAASEPTAALQFVQEYIRELGELKDLQDDARAGLKAAKNDQNLAETMSPVIYSTTRFQLALRADVATLRGMHLTSTAGTTAEIISETDETDIKLYGAINQLATKLMTGALNGPQQGVDYGAMVAEMPKFRAILNNNDQNYIRGATLAVLSLIDTRSDKAGHLSHLTITCAQRNGLIQTLKRDFGSRIEMKNPNEIVTAAGVLWDGLHKPWKCSNQPW